MIDGDKLEQILLNLLTNACKFTQDGAVTLHLHRQPRRLSAEVSDTGIGINPTHHQRIFEPFRQIDMSDTRAYPGTGLGLAVSRRFCTLFGGRITLSNRPGRGARFRVDIPLPVDPELSAVTASPARPASVAG